MNLKSLSNSELLKCVQTLVVEERKLTLEVLHHLRELNARKLYLEQGCASLFDYCVRVLGYSESAAYRRISAMQLLSELPEAEKKIEKGTLTLSNVSQLQTFLKAEKKINKTYNQNQKLELLSAMEGKSSRACEQVLSAVSPQSVPKERMRVVTEDMTELKLVIPKKLLDKLERLKSLNSHRLKDLSWLSVLELLTDDALKRTDPDLKKEKASSKNLASESVINASTNSEFRPPATPTPVLSRVIPAGVKREIWRRDRGRCTYKNPRTGHQCGSTIYLEVDHIQPYALGGKTELNNLRLLCRAHNAYRAEKSFGSLHIKTIN